MRDAFLYVSKWLGLFRLSRLLTKRGLRIICYHGFADGDELAFRPGLFISPSQFAARLRTLAKGRYPVLSLQAALDALQADRLPACATVITVDDVFYGFLVHAMPLLKASRFPVTAYLTTYYCQKEAPVYRLVVQYMLWKTTRPSFDWQALDRSLTGTARLDDPRAKSQVAERLFELGLRQTSEADRVAIERRLGELLGVDYERVATARTFNIVTSDEARSLARDGVDFELHTHRHRLPEDEREVAREIEDNRASILSIVGRRPDHLCYPSGVWSPTVLPWLEAAHVASATTCDPGLNFRGAPPLTLKRILDAHDVSQISFEAELAGYKYLLRRLLPGG